MKPTFETEDVLILDHTPWFLGAILGLLFFASLAAGASMLLVGEPMFGAIALSGAVLPGILLAVFGALVQVRFVRSENRVEFRRRSLFGLTSDTLALDNVARAELVSYTSLNSNTANSTNYQPVLHLRSGGTRPLVRAYSKSASDGPAVEAINRWLGLAEAA